ncbi:pitrilysin family protein [Geotalea sp. SG265]|uniref:M16 family metallopeptidase n=1 Tax=Geotalea sp. SG265 TaxID=2922867 RepID=UPI001FAFCAE8|nr:pitrilysin family protein [Geotalea sp. SG265]
MKHIRRFTTSLCLVLSTILIFSGCAATPPVTTPRSMTFAPLKFEIPRSERVQLKNGMIVYMLEDHELPIVSMTAYVKTGSIYEPADKAGLAALTGAVMRSGGTTSMAPEKLDQELEYMASAIESSAGTDAANVSISCLKRNLDRTLVLFADVVMHPAFREDRVALAKNRTIEGLRRQNDDAKEVADRELQKALYPNHPLGRIPTIETVKGITRDDLVNFHKHYYHPNAMMLAVAGDFDKKELIEKLETLFPGWEKTAVQYPVVPPVQRDLKPEVLLARKDISQSVIRMGELGIDKNNPDLYALKVMDYILGGGFTSRLTQEIRSNQGLAYNVDSRFDVGKIFVGTFVAETETKSQSTVKATMLMRDIIEGMTKGPVTDEELKLAKDYLINSFIFGFARPDAVVNQQLRLEYYGYPAGYLENYRDNLAKATKEDVLRVARKYLHPEKMIVVVVGDEQKFDKPLSTLGPVRELKLENGK